MSSIDNTFIMSPGLFMSSSEEPKYLTIEDADFVFENKKVCSFTGYRPEKFVFKSETDDRCTNLKFRLCSEIEKLIFKGYTEFITGMARGVDIWAAEMVLHLSRSFYPNINLYAAVPYPKQSESWYNWEKDRYNEVLNLCKGVFIIEEYYTPKSMRKRNAFLVNHATSMIAVYDGKSGGTASTLNMANKKNIEIINIIP